MCLYLLSIGVAQDIASHYVDEVGFRVDFTHESTKPPPESEQKTKSYTWSDFFPPNTMNLIDSSHENKCTKEKEK